MATESAGSRRLWLVVAALMLALGVAVTFGPLWQQGANLVVAKSKLPPEVANLDAFGRADATLCAWIVGRNAYTLLHHPLRLFDTEHCAPMKQSMVLCVSLITMAILGIPIWLISGDPIVTYNAALVLQTVAAFVAMYALIVAWTGVPAAGIVAALLYAFHPVRLATIEQPGEMDTAWTLFAVFFAWRLFAHGRWRDAIGLAVACVLLIGASFYQLLAAAFFAPAFIVWLLVRYGFRNVRPAQLVLVAVAMIAATAAFLGPYLAARDVAGIRREVAGTLTQWSYYLPGGSLYPGIPVVLLALIGAFSGRWSAASATKPDPRWALMPGTAILALLIAQETHVYPLFAHAVPGLDTIRVVFRLGAVVVMSLCVFAGLGAVVVIRYLERWGRVAAIGLIALAAVVVLWPIAPLQLGYSWTYFRARPTDETMHFYAELSRLGNAGPILELPYTVQGIQIVNAPANIMAAAFHHRPTSECYASYIAPGREEIAALVDHLPELDAVKALRERGFTTIVLHLGPFEAVGFRNRFEAQAPEPSPPVRLIRLHRR
jgi:hypothetical protein